MGNCFRRCTGNDSDDDQGISYGGQGGAALPGSIPDTVVRFKAVGRDLRDFETTNKLPAMLGYYVTASKSMQRIWFMKLLAAWKSANPAPTTAEAVAVLIIRTLQDHYDIQGLLTFYHLTSSATVPASQPVPDAEEPGIAWPAGVQFEIHTLPVNERTVGDGDGFTVFVDVKKDPRETENLPREIKVAVNRLQNAQAQENHEDAHAQQKRIEARNYKVLDGKDGGAPCLVHKYKIRLRGVDAPEIGQPYGEEAKEVLRDLVKDKQLLIHVYHTDQFDRHIGDVYCNGKFIQEKLLKKGMVWHFTRYDQREAFAKWERAAKAARRGLWADTNPEEPLAYKKRMPKRVNKKGIRSFRNRGA